jgi:hypothetical protein
MFGVTLSPPECIPNPYMGGYHERGAPVHTVLRVKGYKTPPTPPRTTIDLRHCDVPESKIAQTLPSAELSSSWLARKAARDRVERPTGCGRVSEVP